MYLKPVVLSVEHQGKLDSFDCGVPDLNLWLKKFASNNQVRGASRTYVSLNSEGFIAGFFCISNAVIEHESLSASKRRNMPKPILRWVSEKWTSRNNLGDNYVLGGVHYETSASTVHCRVQKERC